ncbi:hypothetical protein Ahy_A09g042101 [Arachis hypogaea]|uniref:DUF4283 domain-containing protein n=1 Tax=Arachis hypogaea TaxID=3818 RepID=A0A445BEW5_ARAHY|nr:hypothetical protein Ahy_A09g042101 [Arachis hypogaea]
MDEGDYRHALFEGHWLVADHYLLVQRWRPLFQPSNDFNLVVKSTTLMPELLNSVNPVINNVGMDIGVSDLNEDMENGNTLNSFGPWMIVKRPQRKNMKKKVSGLDLNKGVNVALGSRYQVLDQ